MLERLKDLRVILIILLVLTWLTAGIGGYFYYKSNQELIANKDNEIMNLENALAKVDKMVTAYAVSADVEMGQTIEDSHLTPVEVPIGMAETLITNKKDLVGKYYKLDLSAGSVISKDVVDTMEITDDMRLFDVVLHTVPIGLKVGSYVDVRISLPMGEDFIGLAHKKVYDINGNVLKLVINENDLHTYNSMLIDSLIYPGTQLYAVEYLQGAVQKPADDYYPVSPNILAIAQRDPNLLTAIKADMIQRRGNLEEGLSEVISDDVKEKLTKILENGRDRYRDDLTKAAKDYEKRMEDLAKQAAKEAKESAKNNK